MAQLCDECNPPCTCSLLSTKSDHVCKMHPGNRALSFDERYEFEKKFDERVSRGQAT